MFAMGSVAVVCMGVATYLAARHVCVQSGGLQRTLRLRLSEVSEKENISLSKQLGLWFGRRPVLMYFLNAMVALQILVDAKNEDSLKSALYRKEHRAAHSLLRFRRESAGLSLVVGFLLLCLAVAAKPSGVFLSAALGAQVVIPALRTRYVLRQALSHRRKCEYQLPDMLSLLVLVVRAGSTLDAALGRYASSFDTELASEVRKLHEAYVSGISTRAQALEDFARSVDSEPVYRFVASVKRSMLSGGSLVEVLEVQLYDMRAFKRECINEEIAKKPVKMLIPLGLFILPAMLILLLGPVLMEVMGGMQSGF